MYLVRYYEIPAGKLQNVCVRNANNTEEARDKVRSCCHVYAFVQTTLLKKED